MSKGRKLGVAAAAALALVLLAAAPAGVHATGPQYKQTYPSKVFTKLWGGVSNVLFCWAEVPYEINREIQMTDNFTGAVVGLGRGTYYAVRRAGLGAVDIVTFPVDIYSNNYESIQRTDFPFIDEVE